MKTFQLTYVNNPQVLFECSNSKIESDVIRGVKQNPNFPQPVFLMDLVRSIQIHYIQTLDA